MRNRSIRWRALVLVCSLTGCGESDSSNGYTFVPSDSGVDASQQDADGSAPDSAHADVGGDVDSESAASGDGPARTDSGHLDSSDALDEPDAATCPALPCSNPGEACDHGVCIKDCRLPDAVPCSTGSVCSVGDDAAGQCVLPTSSCVVTSIAIHCADGDGGPGMVCGPGTACDGSGFCYPSLPCRSLTCSGTTCWGTECPCTRPSPLCAPAPLGSAGNTGTLNDTRFTRGGDGGLVGLDFGQDCSAWGVTVISGADHLRKLDPAGNFTEYTGIADYDMGEVASIHGVSGKFGTTLTSVALTYISYGVAELDASNGSLPLRLLGSTVTLGSGPFGNSILDRGPFGLSWGLDRVLYVGNLDVNGDYYALDLASSTKVSVAVFPSRVHASAPFDKLSMVVALEGGEVDLTPVFGRTGLARKLITLPTHVTSIVRDSWSGRVYAELSDKSIVSFAADGSDLKAFQTAPGKGRIAIAPDGYVYHVTAGYPATQSEIVRWKLPTTL
jgi:hypothetical protein